MVKSAIAHSEYFAIAHSKYIASTSQMHLAIPILKGNYEDGKSANTLQT
jgi:hypothetical protein